MPFSNSRLRLGTFYRVDLGQVLHSVSQKFGVLKVVLPERPDLDLIQEETAEDFQIELVGKQRLDNMAAVHYGDDTLHWVIALRNNVGDIYGDIFAGQEFTLPSINRVKTKLQK